ncbi:MAG: amino acid adenylation domain-containing protein, partial [bacterium]|nr:amino acid adenylation domain-containing protein [bacterium]
LWSFHHILMDGWCLGILMGDFFKIYKGLRTDTPEELGSYHPYGDYIRWLEKQDRSEAGEYWSNYLEGLELEQGGRITDFGTKVAEGTKQSYTAAKKIFTIEEESTTQMHAFCNSVNITMNTLFQSLWGLLLQRYSRTPDVVFGSVVSGRSANIPGIEQMVGLFINTIPIRIRTDIPPQLPSDSNVRESSEQISTETAVHTKAFGSAEPFSQKGTPAPRGGFWPPEASTFLQLVKRVQESALQSGVYDYYPLTEIQAAVPHRGDLMDHFLVFENYPIGKEILDMSEKEDLGFEMVDSHSFDQAGYDFDFVVLPGKQLEVSWNYNADVFTDPGFMDRMAGHFVRMLHQCMDEPAVAVNQIDILTPGEKWQIIDQFNDTKMEYRTEMLLHQIVEAQVARRQLTSESPMLGGNTQSPAVQGPHLITRTQIALSYEELNARALELTRELIEKGFDTGHIAAVMLDRSVEMIIALFAVLKAGGAYLPIDPQAPAARIAHMLEDSRAPFLLTWTKAPQEIPFDGTIVHVDKTESALLGPVESREAGDSFEPGILPLSRPIQPEDAAYIIYTSGTTGKPKGVVVEHRNAVAYVRAFLREFQLTEKDILLQQASYTFDAFVEEIYPILSIGGRVIVNSKEDIQEVKNFARLLETHKATIISCSPLLLSQLNRYAPQLQSLRIAISGGDVLRGDYIDNLLPICDVYNTYGPTEGTVCATYHKCTPEDGRSIPIGRPIGGYHVYILDDNLKMLPIGIPGELCIAGPGVARGYLRQPDLTAEKFVENPLAAGERMYRSGDLARWNPDGTIRFLGRIDRQVNVRGFRVEMEAIESLLAQHPAMYETAVIDREDADGAKYLCAYIVPVDEDDQSVTTAALKEYLGETLPEYMIPSFFIPLQSIPLGTTGKLDRKALPDPDSRAAAGVEFAEAKDEIESTLVSIYRQVLGLEQVGVEDNFFDIGGHSIKAIQVTNLIHKELGSEVGLTGIFKNPTIAELAQVVRDKQGGGFAGIEPVEPRENYELSYAQKRLWVLQRIEAESSAYNMPEHLPIHEAVDVPILEQVIQDIVKRHESLRTRFPHIEGEPVQIIDPESHIKLETLDISHLEGEAQETEMAAIYDQEFRKPFDLEKGPLLRVKLIKYSEERYDFLFTMHHIVSANCLYE